MTRLFKELSMWDRFSVLLKGRMRDLRKISETQASDVITGAIHDIDPDTTVYVL